MDCKNGHSDPERYDNGYCKRCAVEHASEWNARNREKRQARENVRARERSREYRLAALEAYGGRCACCGEDREPFLCVDHTAGGGSEHRRQIQKQKARPPAGATTYRWLKNNGYPSGFQVLCWNCNAAKERGVCPHQQEERGVE